MLAASDAASMASSASMSSVILDLASSHTVLPEPDTAVCSKYPISTDLPTTNLPLSILRCPERQRRRVDLPQPLAPTKPTRCPGMRRHDTSCMSLSCACRYMDGASDGIA